MRALGSRLRRARTTRSTLLLLSHPLLNSGQLLQLIRGQNGFDSGSAFLADLHDFLLFLFHAHGSIVADSTDLLVLVVHDLSDFLLLVLREVQFVLNSGGTTLA